MKIAGLAQGFFHRQNHHPRDAMKPFRVALVLVRFRQGRGWNLAGGLATAAIDRERGHIGHAIFRLPKRPQRFLEPEPERAHNPRGHDGHASAVPTPGRRGKIGHFQEGQTAPDSSCFRWQKPLLITPKRKRKLGALVDCQLSFFSGDLKSDEREQWPSGVFLS
jgi:hypothetical protein